MKESIKEFKKGLFHGLGILLILTIGGISFYLIKARQSSTSGVTVDSSNPASLYVGNNETLTSSKRNRLVQNSVREEVSTSNTDPFDINCERKRQINETVDVFIAGRISANTIHREYPLENSRLIINKANKTKILIKKNSSQAYTTAHLRKKCK